MIKQRIVFLAGYYYPKPTANGICTRAIADWLAEQNYEIHIICLNNGNEPQNEVMGSVYVHRIEPSFYRKLELVKNNKGNRHETMYKVFSLLIKLIHIPFYPVTSFTLAKRYRKTVDNIMQQSKLTVISCFNPMEAMLAGYQIKRKEADINYIGYFLDSLSNEGEVGILSKRFRDRFGLRWEKKFFNAADLVLMTQSHRNYYIGEKFKDFQSKIKFIEIPLLSETFNSKEDTKQYIVYTGMLSKERRNPEYACKLLSKALSDYEVHFYSRGDCDAILAQYSKSRGGNVFNRGFVTHDIARQAIAEAEILLSIGNKNSDMTPSKIFEYISSGKVILHFYYDDRDPCLMYLAKYKNALLIDMNEDMQINLKKVSDFFSENKPQLDYDSIKKEFFKNDPAYTCQLIIDALKE